MSAATTQHVAERNAALADAVIVSLLQAGVGHFFVCPGSRSTPLVWALVRSGAPHTVILDERVAGFCAVGSARVGVPAAVITTSGTAVANLLPAAAEAARDDLPWVACTADRPATDVARGANQTLDQRGLLAGVLADGRFIDIDIDIDASGGDVGDVVDLVDLGDMRAVLGHALLTSSATRGPVHLNVRFDKPLEPPEGWQQRGRDIDASSAPRAHHVDDSLLQKVKEVMAAGADAGVVVLGNIPTALRPATKVLVRRLGWPVVSCVTAGVVVDGVPWLPLASLRNADVRAALSPRAVLWIGGNVVDDAVGLWVAAHRPRCLQLACGGTVRDAFDVADHRMVVDASDLADIAASISDGDAGSTLRGPFNALAAALQEAVEGVWTERPATFSEPEVVREVASSLQAGELFFVGNSMPIRDAALFAQGAIKDGVVVLSNRGVSGIDGNMATILGAALSSKKRATILLGDLAALHDLGGLVALQREGADVVVVVVNNGGGGIFSFLPVASLEGAVVERFFETPHPFSLASVAQGLGITSHTVRDLAGLRAALLATTHHAGPVLIEVVTTRRDNVDVHDGLRADIAAACTKALHGGRGGDELRSSRVTL
jgi:2-succinyl-5-enolpyruvyl-6-hydroxy-3-cyclohexene-1-carboxylate synthase